MTQRQPFTMLSICSAISVLCLEQSLQTVVWESLGNVRFKNDYSFDFKIMTFLILYCASNQNIKMYITLIFVLYWSDPGVWSSYEATKAVALVKRRVQYEMKARVFGFSVAKMFMCLLHVPKAQDLWGCGDMLLWKNIWILRFNVFKSNLKVINCINQNIAQHTSEYHKIYL